MHVIAFPYGEALAAFSAVADDPFCAFLDSAAAGDPRARWSYIATDPFALITADAAGTRVDGRPVPHDPFSALEAALAAQAGDDLSGPAPFRTGAVGFLGYELGRHLERLPVPHALGPAVPEMAFGLYDVIAAFDHAERRAFILSSGRPEADPAARQARAQARGRWLCDRLARAPAAPPAPDWRARGRFAPERPRAAVEQAVGRVIDYIRAGDIFQANLTHRMAADVPDGLGDLELYLRLRASSPAPFAAFLRCGPGLSVMSASPERFLSLAPDGLVETRPIKGTRPRGADPAADAAMARALIASAKDRAENLMIVDLMRNDLGRVSRTGSVRVPVLCGLETFASVHHLVSVVESTLKPGLGPVDLLRACFPGGSITGAPKIRAMEIIHELESAPRGVYCGAVAWIGFDGAMDSSIVIRTITRAGGTLLAQAGGGIVADSDPAAEYEESLVKLAPLLRALSGEDR
ncbi:aminodeoxychorismate synthase component I [Xanthobacter tagetidis]|uniref:aminodeoxychorismate synthase n=1 Tax=Xanthobacter tagetidis TaxID=60216 RepID=A0A3L7ADC9_9HYPH|nr:aminodeoxychorismate synthase component I [Xanthobacter tagetidis]MBB6305859.1 para-aminobenzoate synthetase component 1 [Xanthobacter tagetidis]RLP78383.1 aminodeoxychorismate synthase component I [Xanthobacter tagetidis]